jgi:hypothetical protein
VRHAQRRWPGGNPAPTQRLLGCPAERIVGLRLELTKTGLDPSPVTIAWHLEQERQGRSRPPPSDASCTPRASRTPSPANGRGPPLAARFALNLPGHPDRVRARAPSLEELHNIAPMSDSMFDLTSSSMTPGASTTRPLDRPPSASGDHCPSVRPTSLFRPSLAGVTFFAARRGVFPRDGVVSTAQARARTRCHRFAPAAVSGRDLRRVRRRAACCTHSPGPLRRRNNT